MNVRYKSLGAAGTVTGSRHLLEIDHQNMLLDCGLFQGVRNVRDRNWEEFPVDPSKIHCIVLSHAHIDHSGYIPKIVSLGFKGPIYCTRATHALLKIMLPDSAKLQEEEANWARKKGYSRHKNPEPLYRAKDVEPVFPLIVPVEFDDWITIGMGVKMCFRYAGHILGAAITEILVIGEQQEKRIIYTGDLGRERDSLLFPPSPVDHADILLVESTYGNRINDGSDIEDRLVKIINRSLENEGCILIPAFAVGRSQTILYYLRKLMKSGRIPLTPVYIDSPMSVSVTEIYRAFRKFQRLPSRELASGDSVFDFDQFHYVNNQQESARINEIISNAIIISASGMCSGGRILHHLYHRLPRASDTLLIVGFQAEGSRGRKIEDGEKTISIFGQSVEVKCHVESLSGLSAHADKKELMDWLDKMGGSPKMTFVVHGEVDSSENLATEISSKMKWNTTVPGYLDSFELFKGI